MLVKILQSIIPLLLSLLTREQFVALVDMIFDFVEDAVQDSSNQVDDTVVLPIIQKLRVVMNIPDNDPE